MPHSITTPCGYCHQPCSNHAPLCRFNKRPFEIRFWQNVTKGNACWEWTAGKKSGGYGVMRFNGKRQLTHRISWQLHNGPIPTGMEVMHRCDNPSCVRPDHLLLGTHADNMRDMGLKGRSGPGNHPDRMPRGDNHPSHKYPERWKMGDRHWTRKNSTKVRGENNAQSKLNDQKVREIRALREQGMSGHALARQFGVSEPVIYGIINGTGWRHVR